MRIDIITLFPEMCERVIDESITGQARRAGLVDIRCHNLRDYSDDRRRRVDDYPYGGGQGMLIKAEPVARCFEAICRQTSSRPLFIYMSPQGEVFRQSIAVELSGLENICLLCGHYEGIDERVLETMVDRQLSIGDFVLTGGELPALAITDAVARMIPGVLSENASFEDESHFSGLLEYPQYTRPPVWRGIPVPEVLKSGHAKNIADWKHEQSLERTARLRPDMLEKTSSD
ncbi:MAG: tRNA (guanosine(37)-N1)-methyltransferase TrmD [Ruminococcaceae bacterium]|nr:tRNA (guanosine(37)-N1)-methyltransferase TrmD [Oscillospiraceae bacterium]